MTEPSASEYVCFLEPGRPEMPTDPTEREQRLIGEHFAYLQDLTERGVGVLAGRTTDAPFVGLFVFRAESDEAAEALVGVDPGVAAGVFVARVRPFRVALLAGGLPPG